MEQKHILVIAGQEQLGTFKMAPLRGGFAAGEQPAGLPPGSAAGVLTQLLGAPDRFRPARSHLEAVPVSRLL